MPDCYGGDYIKYIHVYKKLNILNWSIGKTPSLARTSNKNFFFKSHSILHKNTSKEIKKSQNMY